GRYCTARCAKWRRHRIAGSAITAARPMSSSDSPISSVSSAGAERAVPRRLTALILALLVAIGAPVLAPSLCAQWLPAPGEAASPRIPAKAMQHIIARHGPESTAPGAGKYAPGTTPETIRALVAEAMRNAQPTPDTNFRPAQLYDYRFPQIIGTTTE